MTEQEQTQSFERNQIMCDYVQKHGVKITLLSVSSLLTQFALDLQQIRLGNTPRGDVASAFGANFQCQLAAIALGIYAEDSDTWDDGLEEAKSAALLEEHEQAVKRAGPAALVLEVAAYFARLSHADKPVFVSAEAIEKIRTIRMVAYFATQVARLSKDQLDEVAGRTYTYLLTILKGE